MKRVKFMNTWDPNIGFGCFFFNWFRIELAVGKIQLFHFSIEPLKRGYGYVTIMLLGFGFSILIGSLKEV